MAKGVEDTAFYRWSRLTALNEVGGDPDRFGWSPAEFHRFAARLAQDWPGTLTTLSTHDTKRQEDVRARLAVLAEIPQAWLAEVTRWHDRAAALASGLVPDPDTEYLMWQTLAGAWPLGRDRLTEYLVKAMREAKTRTSWTGPDTEYESMVLDVRRAGAGRRRAGRPAQPVRGHAGPGRQGELAGRQAGPAHHARGGRRVPGLRAGRPGPGRPGQPAPGGLRAPP